MKPHTSVHSSAILAGPRSREGPRGKECFALLNACSVALLALLVCIFTSPTCAVDTASHKINVFINDASTGRWHKVEAI